MSTDPTAPVDPVTVDTAATDAGPTADERPARRPLGMKDIVLMVVLGVVFGFLYWVFVQAWTALSVAMGPAGDFAQHLLAGS